MQQTINLKVELGNLDKATQKLERYLELLKEARTLADELASMDIDLVIKQDQE